MLNDAWLFDIEADGLEPTKIHVLSCSRVGSSQVFSTNDYSQIRLFLQNAKYLTGHNIVRFDIPVLERLLGIKISAKLIDTLALSWYLFPERQAHGLEGWGEEFGVPKPEINDWYSLSYEEYKHRCEEDVKINTRLWNNIWNLLLQLYGSETEALRFIDYISFKMHCARLQEESGWKVDVPHVERAIISLLGQFQEKTDALAKVMPKVPIVSKKIPPKKLYKKDGTPTSHGSSWFELIEKYGNNPEQKEVEYVSGYNDPNPGSHEQIKQWLYSLGWVPETHKTKRDKKTGETKQIPQINKEKQKGGGVCDSIKKLYDKEPALELLDNYYVLQHRLGILNGFMNNQKNGWLKACIAGFTNTLRFKHAEIVNLPKVNVLFGEEVRGSLTVPDGYILCGADMTSLEDRLKQHYIYPYDPDYVNEMNVPDFDPHLDIAILGNRITKEQADIYKKGEDKEAIKPIKRIRDIFKNVNYAGQYGAGAPRIALTGGISVEEARELHKIYWERNHSIKKCAKDQKTKIVNKQLWLYNPVSKFWYSLRNEKDIFSTLVQGTASYVFDRWVQFILEVRPQLTAQFHDEIVLCIRKGFEDKAKELCDTALEKLNEELKLNRRLDIGVQFGERYSQIH
jgi:hypothetical protein